MSNFYFYVHKRDIYIQIMFFPYETFPAKLQSRYDVEVRVQKLSSTTAARWQDISCDVKQCASFFRLKPTL
jgi:hypothetical protein